MNRGKEIASLRSQWQGW